MTDHQPLQASDGQGQAPAPPKKRVKTIERGDDYFQGRYKGYEIFIERETSPDHWYIQVYGDDGYLYDGWADDDTVTLDDAIADALRGSEL